MYLCILEDCIPKYKESKTSGTNAFGPWSGQPGVPYETKLRCALPGRDVLHGCCDKEAGPRVTLLLGKGVYSVQEPFRHRDVHALGTV
jgi:hypothetical protein